MLLCVACWCAKSKARPWLVACLHVNAYAFIVLLRNERHVNVRARWLMTARTLSLKTKRHFAASASGSSTASSVTSPTTGSSTASSVTSPAGRCVLLRSLGGIGRKRVSAAKHAHAPYAWSKTVSPGAITLWHLQWIHPMPAPQRPRDCSGS